ncbi:type I-F CRISPR-associated protein Csy1 [Wohlfahrtiimonas chitiniclastica]|uniref:Type I-F CRISPR-associated protein Csy1 n=1 Tax=Wohlfahrtiimonas chitiniclastica TaxID=400946 RepID=A0AB35BYB8_9GAMM|nr:type I-F CRISPR-associated protein Csy1 [Wohlfahrtiimonas chitiniclastica]MBS7824031.1 type I-F CRISPR-associated protein Csy1 [Wohlfahrtiimonas chitiniclastica]MBS7840139.1 type I-F CRISPR-associated protein Csy1 [Wohlfahrtiimonas chitiniclastica]
MIESIQEYITGRQTSWLEKKIKNAKEDQEAIAQLMEEAADHFHPKIWIEDAAKRAKQLVMTTHPCKFSHPSAKSTPIMATATASHDGYVRTGNIRTVTGADVYGNAAALDVYKFLMLPLTEDCTVIEGFETRHPLLVQYIEGLGLNFDEIAQEFLEIKTDDGELKTDGLLKQVYFPLGDGQYHLLSILTSSNTLMRVKTEIDEMRFSEFSKAARKARREGKWHEPYQDVLDLTLLSHGGTKPQNISSINSQMAGKVYLLPCLPPRLKKRAVRVPTSDFFKQTLYLKKEHSRFKTLHRFVKQDYNTHEVRATIERIIHGIIDVILRKAYQVRASMPAKWSEDERYHNLPKVQKIWLDAQYQAECEDQEWQQEMAKMITKCIVSEYETVDRAHKLDEPARKAIRLAVMACLANDKEFF